MAKKNKGGGRGQGRGQSQGRGRGGGRGQGRGRGGTRGLNPDERGGGRGRGEGRGRGQDPDIQGRGEEDPLQSSSTNDVQPSEPQAPLEHSGLLEMQWFTGLCGLFSEVGMENSEELLTSEAAQQFYKEAVEDFKETAAISLLGSSSMYLCVGELWLGASDLNKAKDMYRLAAAKLDEAFSVYGGDFTAGLFELGMLKGKMAELEVRIEEELHPFDEGWDGMKADKLFVEADKLMERALDMLKKNKKKKVLKEGMKEEYIIRHWGHFLYEMSKNEYRLTLAELDIKDYKTTLQRALEKLKSGGCTKDDVAEYLEYHPSTGADDYNSEDD